MITLIKATPQHIPEIVTIAEKAWEKAYRDILSLNQISYMFEMMYSPDALLKQITKLNHHFLIIKKTESQVYQGFVSFELDYNDSNKTKLHKLYVLPDTQGLGLGRRLIEEVCI